MNNLLEQAIEIPITQYVELENPIFKGQTRLDKDNKYWVVVENNNILYKIHNTLL